MRLNQLNTTICNKIDGCFEKNGTRNRLVIFSDDTGKWSKIEYSQLRGGTSPCVATYEDALKIAEDTIKGIGAYQQGMRLAETSVTKNPTDLLAAAISFTRVN